MNQHLGATYSLSVLIVVGFAIVMSRPDPSPHLASAPKTLESVSHAGGKTETVSRREPSRKPAKKSEPLQATALKSHAMSPDSVVRPVSEVRVKPRVLPKESFTLASTGESLTDVAKRVYGTGDAAPKLWKANRDQLESPTSTLRAGMLLRTP